MSTGTTFTIHYCFHFICSLAHTHTHTYTQVLDLLSAMNLSQYKAAFAKEMISGEILLECNEMDLEKELGVTSKIHRIRLMKVVDGHHSAKNILEGQNPYEF